MEQSPGFLLKSQRNYHWECRVYQDFLGSQEGLHIRLKITSLGFDSFVEDFYAFYAVLQTLEKVPKTHNDINNVNIKGTVSQKITGFKSGINW